MNFTLQQKYDFICSKLKLTDVDLWERDALLEFPPILYFQFGTTAPETVDDAIVTWMGLHNCNCGIGD